MIAMAEDERYPPTFLSLQRNGHLAGMVRLRKMPVQVREEWRPWKRPRPEWLWFADFALGSGPDCVRHREDLLVGTDDDARWILDPERRGQMSFDTEVGRQVFDLGEQLPIDARAD